MLLGFGAICALVGALVLSQHPLTGKAPPPDMIVTSGDELFELLGVIDLPYISLGHQPRYRIGQPIEFSAKSTINGYLTVLLLDAGNRWPSEARLVTNEAVQVNREVKLPKDKTFPLLAAPPTGTMRVMALVTPAPFTWTASFDTGQVNITKLLSLGVAASSVQTIQIDP